MKRFGVRCGVGEYGIFCSPYICSSKHTVGGAPWAFRSPFRCSAAASDSHSHGARAQHQQQGLRSRAAGALALAPATWFRRHSGKPHCGKQPANCLRCNLHRLCQRPSSTLLPLSRSGPALLRQKLTNSHLLVVAAERPIDHPRSFVSPTGSTEQHKAPLPQVQHTPPAARVPRLRPAAAQRP